jgi:predicted transcriptional regulator
MISCDTHAIRKALNLSLNEMAVLCDIFVLCQNPRYGYWCVKSKDKIAEWLDLSRDTVYRAIGSLKKKGYITGNEQGHLRCSQYIFDIETAQEEIAILIRNNETELITAKMSKMLQSENQTPSEIATTPSENQTMDRLKIRLGPSENQTLDIQEIDIENNIESSANKNVSKKRVHAAPSTCTLEEAVEYSEKNGFNKEFAAKFHGYYVRCEWKDSQGKIVKNWKNRMNSWMSREDNSRYMTSTNTDVIKMNGFSKDNKTGKYFRVWERDGKTYQCDSGGTFMYGDDRDKIPYNQ